MYPKNNASPPSYDVGALVQVSDGAMQTSGESARVKIGSGAWGAAAGTTACDATSGIWTYTPSQAETNAESFIVAIYKSGSTSISRTVVPSASSTAGQAALETSTQASIDAIEEDTGTTLPAAIKDGYGYVLTIFAGAIANAGTSAEAYTFTYDGTDYAVTYADLDSDGNRGTTVLSKP